MLQALDASTGMRYSGQHRIWLQIHESTASEQHRIWSQVHGFTASSWRVVGSMWCGLLWNIKTRIEDTGFPDEDNLFSSYHDHKFLIQNITYPKCLEPTWPRPASNSCQLAFHHLILRFQTHHHQAESLMATWDSLNKLSQSASRKPQAKHSSLMKLCAEQMDIDDPDILD